MQTFLVLWVNSQNYTTLLASSEKPNEMRQSKNETDLSDFIKIIDWFEAQQKLDNIVFSQAKIKRPDQVKTLKLPEIDFPKNYAAGYNYWSFFTICKSFIDIRKKSEHSRS